MEILHKNQQTRAYLLKHKPKTPQIYVNVWYIILQSNKNEKTWHKTMYFSEKHYINKNATDEQASENQMDERRSQISDPV